MPLGPITLRPGIDKASSKLLNEAGWTDASLVRFRGGMPEKWGGWVRYAPVVLEGMARTLRAWATLAGERMLAVGTSSRLYALRGGVAYDLSPVDRTVAVSTLAATGGVVAVTASAAHGLAAGDWITFDDVSGQTRTPSGISGAGISLSGDYLVTAVSSATVFSFVAAAAGSGTLSGTSPAVRCFLGSGAPSAVQGSGWGSAPWGGFLWGASYSGPQAPVRTLEAREWSLETWGERLLACPRGGRILEFVPQAESGAVTSRAAYVTHATPSLGPPLKVGLVLVAMPERHAVAFGASDLGAATAWDPMLVRWSDVEDYTSWQATATNSAGSFRLQGGSEIRAARNARLQTLVWTDTGLHLMRFLGFPLVYGFERVAEDCGIIGPAAHVELGGAVYWMSGRNFHRYTGGGAELLPCPLLEDVLSRLTGAQRRKVCAGCNAATSEVLWFFPADGALECSHYVAFNTAEGVWSCGALGRGAWLDSGLLDRPLAAGQAPAGPLGEGLQPRSLVWQHETGTSADGAPMLEFIQSGWFKMSGGEAIMFASQVIPDFDRLAGSVRVSFQVSDYPNRAPRTVGPFALSAATLRRPFRARGRLMSMRIEGADVGNDWRLGQLLVNSQQDGTR